MTPKLRGRILGNFMYYEYLRNSNTGAPRTPRPEPTYFLKFGSPIEPATSTPYR